MGSSSEAKPEEAPAGSSKLVAELREATSDLHERLDRGVAATEALTSRDGYARFLAASLAAAEPLERGLASLPATASFASGNRASRIREDLAALGVPADEEAGAVSGDAIVPASKAEAFGTSYVLEGSALGGLVLARNVKEKLGLGDAETSYLRLRGAETPAHWRGFLGELETWASSASPAERREACAAAMRTFEIYLAAFRRAGLFGDER